MAARLAQSRRSQAVFGRRGLGVFPWPSAGSGVSLADNCLKPPPNNPGPVTGINHLTFAVSDLNRSVAFYSELLGFAVRMQGPSSAYLQAGTLWLALVVDPDVRLAPLPEYSHAAFTVSPSDLPVVAARLADAGVERWQESDRADSVYFLDPDGHKLEVHSGDLDSRLQARAR